jgi:ectoine hydroxylase-related dioxygenase (phytanoyl-CoA dioxygenase family)
MLGAVPEAEEHRMRWTPPTAEETRRDLDALEREGFVVIERLLDSADLDEMRRVLEPFLAAGLHGRNDFEGHRTQRVYALVARGEIFTEVVCHPRITAICDALLAPNYLLSASQAICIHPGETPQPLHTDDVFYPIPRPRKPVSWSTIWAIDPFTKESGATQVIPGSHRWSDAELADLFQAVDFATDRAGRPRPESERAADLAYVDRLVTVEMPPGSVVVFAGTLVHRGGGATGARSRLAFSNQYCEPWARPQENFVLGMPRERIRAMPEAVRRMLGFSIHPPFMGHYGGRHPERILDPEGPQPQ